MTKKEIKKIMKNYPIFKSNRYEYDYRFMDHYIKILDTNSNTQLTINSPTVYEIHKGKRDGSRFIRKNSKINRLQKSDKVIFVLLDKPYRILKHINESELEDISSKAQVHKMKFAHTLEDFQSILQKAI